MCILCMFFKQCSLYGSMQLLIGSTLCISMDPHVWPVENTLPWCFVSREVSVLFTKDRFRHCFRIFARGLCSKHCLTSLELLFCTDAAKKPWLTGWRLGGFALIAAHDFPKSNLSCCISVNLSGSMAVYVAEVVSPFFPHVGIWNTLGIQSVSFVHSVLFFRHLPRGWCVEFPCEGKASHLKKLPNTSKSLLELSAVYLYLGHNVCTLMTLWELLSVNVFFLKCCTDNINSELLKLVLQILTHHAGYQRITYALAEVLKY